MSTREKSLFSLLHIGISIHALNKRAERGAGLSLVQWCLLKCLIDMPGSSASALAKEVGVHPSTLTQTLKRLERKDLVIVVADPKDSRKKVISLTRAGKESLERTTGMMNRWSQGLASVAVELGTVRSHLQGKSFP